jgi:hypothetical protein
MAVQEISTQRLFSQQLAQTHFELPDEVASWLGALQGQDYAGAKWSLGLRLPGSTEAGIEQAIAERTVVRTWALRGTLHFLAATDVRWMLALLSARLIAGSARRNRELKLDEHTLIRSSDLLAQAVEGGAQRTRAELFSILEQNGISTEGQRGVHMLHRASLEGLLCQGVMQGRNPVFFTLDGLPTQGRAFSRNEALAELARRYFTSRGPATLQDFIWWSGLPSVEAKAGLEAIYSQMDKETVNGQTYWFSPSEPKTRKSSPDIYLLPGFDEYLLAYKDRSASLDVPNYKSLTPTNGMLPATIVSVGRVIGTWKRSIKKDKVLIEANPLTTFSDEENNAFAIAAGRFGEYLGLSAELQTRSS